VGDLEEHAPENQGFDYAYYGLYNGAIFGWADSWNFYQGDIVPGTPPWFDMPSFERYEELTGIHIDGLMRGRRGEGREEVRPITSSLVMEEYEDECAEEIIEYVRAHEGADRPFFIYWATYCQQIASSPRDHRFGEDVDYVNNQAAQLGQHNAHLERLLTTLEETGLEENTLLVWVSDNGPMYAFWPNAGYTLLRGAKGDVYEGGIRTPGIARWPGMIEPGQQIVDFIHVTDLFTTAARLTGVIDQLPEDRVIDGVDQTALLLLGDGHTRRNVTYHYSGGNLGAVRWGPYKMVITEGHGGLPGMEIYNIMRDPAERFGQMYNYMQMIAPVQRVIQAHMRTIAQFPHRTLQPQHDMAPEAELTPHD
jgi:arylsulfatase